MDVRKRLGAALRDLHDVPGVGELHFQAGEDPLLVVDDEKSLATSLLRGARGFRRWSVQCSQGGS